MSLATTAQSLIKRNGRLVSLVSPVVEPADSNKPWRGPDPEDEPTTTSVYAVFTDEFSGEMSRSLYQALAAGLGDPPQRGQSQFIVAGLDVPSLDLKTVATIADGDKVWRVTNVTKVQPGAELMLVKFMVKQ